MPRNVIDTSIHGLRSETQPSARKQTLPRPFLRDLRGLDELKIESALVRENSPVIGASLAKLDFAARRARSPLESGAGRACSKT